MSVGSIIDWVFGRFKGRRGFTCLIGWNVEVSGRNKAEKEPVTCDGHLKMEVKGRYGEKLANVAISGCD